MLIETLRKKLNALPRFSFLLDQANNVRRVPNRYGAWIEWQAAHELFDPEVLNGSTPIDMILHCPKCFTQHIDSSSTEDAWDNPPHRSHLCHQCGNIWRPADVSTNGVATIKTKGERDGSHPRMTKFVAFLTALRALCEQHKVTLSTSGYDGLQVWDRDEDADPLHANGIDDCTKP